MDVLILEVMNGQTNVHDIVRFLISQMLAMTEHDTQESSYDGRGDGRTDEQTKTDKISDELQTEATNIHWPTKN